MVKAIGDVAMYMKSLFVTHVLPNLIYLWKARKDICSLICLVLASVAYLFVYPLNKRKENNGPTAAVAASTEALPDVSDLFEKPKPVDISKEASRVLGSLGIAVAETVDNHGSSQMNTHPIVGGDPHMNRIKGKSIGNMFLRWYRKSKRNSLTPDSPSPPPKLSVNDAINAINESMAKTELGVSIQPLGINPVSKMIAKAQRSSSEEDCNDCSGDKEAGFVAAGSKNNSRQVTPNTLSSAELVETKELVAPSQERAAQTALLEGEESNSNSNSNIGLVYVSNRSDMSAVDDIQRARRIENPGLEILRNNAKRDLNNSSESGNSANSTGALVGEDGRWDQNPAKEVFSKLNPTDATALQRAIAALQSASTSTVEDSCENGATTEDCIEQCFNPAMDELQRLRNSNSSNNRGNSSNVLANKRDNCGQRESSVPSSSASYSVCPEGSDNDSSLNEHVADLLSSSKTSKQRRTSMLAGNSSTAAIESAEISSNCDTEGFDFDSTNTFSSGTSIVADDGKQASEALYRRTNDFFNEIRKQKTKAAPTEPLQQSSNSDRTDSDYNNSNSSNEEVSLNPLRSINKGGIARRQSQFAALQIEIDAIKIASESFSECSEVDDSSNAVSSAHFNHQNTEQFLQTNRQLHQLRNNTVCNSNSNSDSGNGNTSNNNNTSNSNLDGETKASRRASIGTVLLRAGSGGGCVSTKAASSASASEVASASAILPPAAVARSRSNSLKQGDEKQCVDTLDTSQCSVTDSNNQNAGMAAFIQAKTAEQFHQLRKSAAVDSAASFSSNTAQQDPALIAMNKAAASAAAERAANPLYSPRHRQTSATAKGRFGDTSPSKDIATVSALGCSGAAASEGVGLTIGAYNRTNDHFNSISTKKAAAAATKQDKEPETNASAKSEASVLPSPFPLFRILSEKLTK